MSKMWKVLVVDDEADCRNFAKSVLESKLPAQVIIGKNGEEGLRLARKEQPDLIVLDVMMPVKDGYDTFLELHEDPQTSAIPVIMLSTLTEVRVHMEGRPIQEQPAHFVEKPVEPVVLLRVARTVLGINK
ncbi:Response regulatory domain-containing protein [Gammaproteobacteria bacterium]